MVVVVVLLEGTQPPRARSRRSPRFEARSLLLLPSPLPLSEPRARSKAALDTGVGSSGAVGRESGESGNSADKGSDDVMMVMWHEQEEV